MKTNHGIIYRLALLVASTSLIGLLQVMPVHALTGAYQASDVLGQADGSGNPAFDTKDDDNGKDPIDGTGMDYVSGTEIDTVGHRLFVTDCENNRILIYNLDTTNNLVDHTADNVLGQPSMADDASDDDQDSLNCPTGPSYDSEHKRLFVNDTYNNRVMVWDLSSGVTDGMDAMAELGQADWGQSSGNRGTGVDANTLSYNWGNTAYDKTHNWLYVTDDANNRVVIYDLSDGITNGMDAAYVLGQTAMDDTSTYSTTQNSFKDPYSLTYDNQHQRLFVGDYNNNRVMIFDMSGEVSTGMDASWQLGQPDFVTDDSRVDGSSIAEPIGFAYDNSNNRLYVSDDNYYRVAIFDVSSFTNNNQPLVGVIGVPDFTTDVDGDCIASRTTLCDAEGAIAFDPTNNRIYVPDSSNNRVLIFDFVHITTPHGALTAASAGSDYNFSFTTTSNQCDESFSKTGGSLPDGLTLSPDGKITGKPTQPGTSSFEIAVTDDCGVLGTFIEDPPYTITVSAGAPATGYAQAIGGNALPYTLITIGITLCIGYTFYGRRPQLTQ
jgi:DNA-binding beta-propeller fold protein YncE